MQPTSVIARDQHEASGDAATNREKVLQLVRDNPGFTAVELDERQGGLYCEQVTRHEISRRLPELRKAGRVRNGEPRKCRVSGSKQLTWYAVE